MDSENCSITENSSSHLERGQKGKSCDFLHSGMISTFDVWNRAENGEIIRGLGYVLFQSVKEKLGIGKYLSSYEKTRYLYERELYDFQMILKGLFL